MENMDNNKKYQVIVVGGGHAGIEAGMIAATMGAKTLVLTIALDNVGQMSCNPAIGGLAKGHLVREIDALGGVMAKAIDATGIQFRTLNTKKGPAVRALRAQADRLAYMRYMRRCLELKENLDLKQGSVKDIRVRNNRVEGVITRDGVSFEAESVILTTGTFMNGLVHVGLNNYSAGRAGEPAAEGISERLEAEGMKLGRLKTGTPPRLHCRSIDFANLEPQYGDEPIRPFSFMNDGLTRNQQCCYLTATNAKTHDIIRSGLDRSPLYSGVIEGVGPRYCPSIEDKVVRFPEKESHQIFLEPESPSSEEYYPNGVPTSLPPDVQEKFLQSIPGLHDVEIVRMGYAIEYDFINPVQLYPTLETKAIDHLYHAGQINGTSGYEEAAAQGLVAGINAVLKLRDQDPFIIRRDQGYAGVLIDDLINKGTQEPYRMFTSRAEHRLLLREDNADQRLTEVGRHLGTVDDARWQRFEDKMEHLAKGREILSSQRITPSDKDAVARLGIEGLANGLEIREILKRPEINIKNLSQVYSQLTSLPPGVQEQLEIETKYAGYIDRQLKQIDRMQKVEKIRIPPHTDYDAIIGLSSEVKEKLKQVQPYTLGQASRIPGVTPAAIAILSIVLQQENSNAI